MFHGYMQWLLPDGGVLLRGHLGAVDPFGAGFPQLSHGEFLLVAPSHPLSFLDSLRLGGVFI